MSLEQVVSPDTKLALRVLGRSGRRMMAYRKGWAVMGSADARVRPQAVLPQAEGERLIAEGAVRPARGGGYVLASIEEAEAPEEDVVHVSPAAFFVAAGGGAAKRKGSGAGFLALAQRARMGEGPLSLRQVEAGLRLVRDAEQAGRDPKLSIKWDGVVVDGGGGPSLGGLAPTARRAEQRLRSVRAEAGEAAFTLAWTACVEARPLVVLAVRAGVRAGKAGAMLAAALEKVARGYEG
jgi:hypothetical protein